MKPGRAAAVSALTAAILACGAQPGAAQAVEPREPVEGTEVGGRVHLQLHTTSQGGAGAPASEFLVRRARIWVASRLNDWIDAAVQVDVAKGKVAGRYAFLRLSFDPAFRVSFGQFKRAFDLFELTSSSRILVVERDGAIAGVEGCAGVDNVCSYSRFSERLQLSSVDVGVLAEGTLSDGSWRYLVSVTNGTGSVGREENDGKSVAARLEWRPVERLRLGLNATAHDFPNPVTGGDDYAPAYAADAEWGDFDGGLHLQVGVLGGRNWKVLDDAGKAATFRTAQAIVTYRAPLASGGRIEAVEPVARVSWGDPRRDTPSDGGWLLTPGLILHFDGRNKVAANVDVWRPREGATAWGLKLQTYVYF